MGWDGRKKMDQRKQAREGMLRRGVEASRDMPKATGFCWVDEDLEEGYSHWKDGYTR